MRPDGRAVSYFGDLHPSFSGNVVKAMGGAKQGYPVLTRTMEKLPAAQRSPEAPDVPTFTNPVFAENFPDPGVISADGTWYAYGTNDATSNVPLLTSADLEALDQAFNTFNSVS